ncbi:hypothetical protein, partial [Microbispora hainanensis]
RQPREHHIHQISDLQHASGWQVITERHHRLRDRAEDRTVPSSGTALRRGGRPVGNMWSFGP